MKAITLWQPWASLIVAGAKRLETRSWQTRHRGPLAIHAARKLWPAAAELCRREPIRQVLAGAGILSVDALPLSAIVGSAVVHKCVRTDEIDLDLLSEVELALGDFGPGRWVWILRRPTRLAVPIPTVGQRALFHIPDLPGALPCT
jgi:hypothetical protein